MNGRRNTACFLLGIILAHLPLVAQPDWVKIGTDYPNWLFDIVCFTPSVVIVNAEIGYPRERELFLRSEDGGVTWDSLWIGFDDAKAPFVADLTRVISETEAFVSGSYSPRSGGRVRSLIAKTTDQGRTWRKITSDTTANLSRVWMFPNGVGYVSGYEEWDGTAIMGRTVDRGETWTWHRLPIRYPGYDLNFRDSLLGMMLYAASPRSGIYRTTDGGLTWAETHSFSPRYSLDIEYVSGDTWLLDSPAGISRSTDNGTSWTVVEPKDCGYRFSVVNERVVYAIARDPCAPIMKSTDAGQTWFDQTVEPPNVSLMSIGVANDSVAYAAGAAGVVLKTVTAGNVGGVDEAVGADDRLSADVRDGLLGARFKTSATDRRLTVFDMAGGLLHSTVIGSGETSAVVGVLPAGIYILRLAHEVRRVAIVR